MHTEIISYLKSYENKYNFIHITPTEFEINNPNIPLKIFNGDSEGIYTSKNDASKKAYIVHTSFSSYGIVSNLLLSILIFKFLSFLI